MLCAKSMRGGARTLGQRQRHSKCDLLLAADTGDAKLPVGSSDSIQRKIVQMSWNSKAEEMEKLYLTYKSLSPRIHFEMLLAIILLRVQAQG
jgi:hypothetical protein